MFKNFLNNLYNRFLKAIGGISREAANEEKESVVRAFSAVLDMSGVKPGDLLKAAKTRKRQATQIRRKAEKEKAAALKLAAEKGELVLEASGVEEATEQVLAVLANVNLNLTSDQFDLPSA